MNRFLQDMGKYPFVLRRQVFMEEFILMGIELVMLILIQSGCLFSLANVKLYQEHIVRIETDWGISYTERFYPTYSGYTVTIY